MFCGRITLNISIAKVKSSRVDHLQNGQQGGDRAADWRLGGGQPATTTTTTTTGRHNIIMEYVRLSEISDGKILQTNSINSYQVTQSFGKRTVSFASTNHISEHSQKRFTSFFGPVETSSPLPHRPTTLNTLGHRKRLQAVIYPHTLVLPSPLPSTILVDPGQSPRAQPDTSRTLAKADTSAFGTPVKSSGEKDREQMMDTTKELKVKQLERRIEVAYFIQSAMRFLLETGFLLLQYAFFDFNVPSVYRCERKPCPNTVSYTLRLLPVLF